MEQLDSVFQFDHIAGCSAHEHEHLLLSCYPSGWICVDLTLIQNQRPEISCKILIKNCNNMKYMPKKKFEKKSHSE